MRSNSLLRTLRSLSASIGLVAVVGCFDEPEPVIDDSGTTCEGASCTTTEDGVTSIGPGVTTESTGVADDSTDSTDGPGSSSGPEPGSSSSEGGDSTGPAPMCGDGEVNQPEEMCDSTPGCTDDCTFEDYDCNPLSDAGCVEGLRCGAVDVPMETFSCMLPGRAGVGDPCSGVPANDSDCDVGLTCLFNFNTPLCNMGNCCVEYCDLLDAGFMCSGGAVCRPFFIGPMGQGLEHLGFCGSP